MGNWLKTDEAQQAVIALQMVNNQLPKAKIDPHHWQWVIIGMHNALQGFMVLALRGTDGLNVLSEKSAEEWMRAYESGDRSNLKLKLDTFPNLYEKIKSDRMKMYTYSKPLVPSDSQARSIKKLNSLRNNFIHFTPKGWSLEVSGLPQIVVDCLKVILFLAFDSGNVTWHEIALKDQTNKLVEKIKQDAILIKKSYSR